MSITIEKIPISKLDILSTNTDEIDDGIFILSGSNGEISSGNFYIIENKISNDLGIVQLKEKVQTLYSIVNNKQYKLIAISNDNDNNIKDFGLIHEIVENATGGISSINSISLRDRLSSKITGTEYSQLCAENSPWIEKSNITDDTGNASDKVASQKLVTDISSNLLSYLDTNRDDYILTSYIVSAPGNETNKVASYSLAKKICDKLDDLVLSRDIVNTPGNASHKVASQKLVTDISSFITEIKLNLSNDYILSNELYDRDDGILINLSDAQSDDDKLLTFNAFSDLNHKISVKLQSIGSIQSIYVPPCILSGDGENTKYVRNENYIEVFRNRIKPNYQLNFEVCKEKNFPFLPQYIVGLYNDSVWQLSSGIYNKGELIYQTTKKGDIIKYLSSYYIQKYNNRYVKKSDKFNKHKIQTSKQQFLKDTYDNKFLYNVTNLEGRSKPSRAYCKDGKLYFF